MSDEQKPSGLVLSQVDRIMTQVDHQRVKLEKLLPDWMQVDRFLFQIRLALTTGKSAEKLQLCTPRSIVESALTAATLGLDPSGRLGSGYLVPYKDQCTFIPGYRGLIDLAVRSGFVKSVNAWVVHEGDVFSAQAGKMPKHIPFMPKTSEDPNPGPVYAAWSRAQLRNGGIECEVMSLREINAIKARSAAARYGSSPWQTDEEEMQKKTVIRRLVKKLPLSSTGALNATFERFTQAVEQDDAVDAEFHEEDLPPEEPVQSRTEQIKNQL